jgi:hypothetical protein
VVKDIQTYAKWSDGKGFGPHNLLGLQGIFLDETPNEWSPEAGKYLEVVAGVARSLGDDPLVRPARFFLFGLTSISLFASYMIPFKSLLIVDTAKVLYRTTVTFSGVP